MHRLQNVVISPDQSYVTTVIIADRSGLKSGCVPLYFPLNNANAVQRPDAHRRWHQMLIACTHVHSFMLNYEQHPDTPVALFLWNENPRVNKFVGRWLEQLQIAQKCIEEDQQRHKAAADRRGRPAEVLEVGDLVLVHIKHFRLKPGLKLKLAPRYLGPFPITEMIGQHKLSFRVELPTSPHRMYNVFHVSSLRKYHCDGPYQPPAIPKVEDSELFFLDLSHL